MNQNQYNGKELILKKGEEKRILSGHLWVFSNEVKEIRGLPASGDTVRLIDGSGRFIGIGFFNTDSLISFRFLSGKDEEINSDFFKTRIKNAVDFRRNIYPGLESFRAVFGESDCLPGLIVDKYGEYLAVQFLSAGMEKNKDLVVNALRDVFSPKGIIARNDSALRKLEGLESKVEVIFGNVPERFRIEENGCVFWVDLYSGQKTGFFFDQRENRAALSKYCSGKKVLDCFCHTGAFGIYAAKAGASEITCVDSSKTAIALAGENAKLNCLENLFCGVEADISDYLLKIRKENIKFDIIILDPPALIKSKKHFIPGYKAYRKLSILALDNLSGSGILAVSSCSHNLSFYDFRNMLAESAGKLGKQVRLIEQRSQARDHPVLLSMPETEYLKFAILQVI